jgi:hypothetical protein
MKISLKHNKQLPVGSYLNFTCKFGGYEFVNWENFDEISVAVEELNQKKSGIFQEYEHMMNTLYSLLKSNR